MSLLSILPVSTMVAAPVVVPPAVRDPADIMTAQFPDDSYQFVLPPVAYPNIGPLKAMLATYQALVLAYNAAVLIFIGQTTVQNASGTYLDAHGAKYGVLRYTAELDNPYRARILAALSRGRNTLQAIHDTLQDYENGLSITTGGSPITVVVYDAESAPALVAADIAAGQPVPVFSFVIELDSQLNIDSAFFADYAAVDDQAFLFPGGTTFSNDSSTGDPNIPSLVKTVRLADTVPIYKSVVAYDSSVDPQNPSF